MRTDGQPLLRLRQLRRQQALVITRQLGNLPLLLLLQDLNRAAIVELLDSCLLTDEELAAGKSAEQWMAEDPLFGPDE
jgi:hypothetical protein